MENRTERAVECFVRDGMPLQARILVEQRADGRELVRCPVRGRAYVLTPEEHVRQAIVWFLSQGACSSDRWRRSLRVEVEQCSLDVALYVSETVTGPAFRPRLAVAVIETKRVASDLEDHVQQLKGYLDRERCASGLLFNGRSALWVTSSGAGVAPQIIPLASMGEVEARIDGAESSALEFAEAHRRMFRAAAAGDFAGLCALIEAYGSDASLTFAISMRAHGSLGRFQAHSLRVDDSDRITYRLRGIASKNRAELRRKDFHSLLSVCPL